MLPSWVYIAFYAALGLGIAWGLWKIQSPRLVKQILEPTGGMIKRPPDWHHSEHHEPGRLRWIISREEAPDGNYVTGVEVRVFPMVGEEEGLEARQFVLDYLEQRKAAGQVIRAGKPKEAGMFTRASQETTEGEYHYLSEGFWEKSGQQIAVIVEARTTKKLWAKYERVFLDIGEISVADMGRFTKEPGVKVTKGQLTGHWRKPKGQSIENLYLNKDNTLILELGSPGHAPFQLAGTWMVERGVLHYKYTAAPLGLAELMPRSAAQFRVVEVGRDYVVIENMQGKEERYERVS
jgi:hypothetical protein